MKVGMPRQLLVLLVGGAILLSGCVAPPASRSQVDAPTGERTGPPKTLRTAVLREPSAGLIFGSGGNAAAQVRWMFHMSLTRYDPEGNLHPHIAKKLPSIADGDWLVLPDGGMELTWKLRPNVKWHDGTPLTADDFVFGVHVAKDPNLEVGTSALALVRELAAPDSETVVVRWSRPYFDANVASPPSFVALPRHLLADLYQQSDPAAFMNNSYWTTGFIGLGPYRVAEWVLGSHTDAAAFDDYFLGRPKIDRVIIRYIPDNNAMVAALLSGDIDMVNPSALKMPDLQPVINNWGPQGGTIIPSMTSIVIARLQFRDPSAPWGEYVTTLDLPQRQSVHADLLRWLGDEVIFLPLFYAVGSSITAHRRGIRGPAGITPVQQVGTWNIHEWEMD